MSVGGAFEVEGVADQLRLGERRSTKIAPRMATLVAGGNGDDGMTSRGGGNGTHKARRQGRVEALAVHCRVDRGVGFVAIALELTEGAALPDFVDALRLLAEADCLPCSRLKATTSVGDPAASGGAGGRYSLSELLNSP